MLATDRSGGHLSAKLNKRCVMMQVFSVLTGADHCTALDRTSHPDQQSECERARTALRADASPCSSVPGATFPPRRSCRRDPDSPLKLTVGTPPAPAHWSLTC